jgi:hypothetical protein
MLGHDQSSRVRGEVLAVPYMEVLLVFTLSSGPGVCHSGASCSWRADVTEPTLLEISGNDCGH